MGSVDLVLRFHYHVGMSPENRSPTSFEDVDGSAGALGLVAYLDIVDDLPLAQAYKADALKLLAPEPGCRLLEIGCGTGENSRILARHVGSGGRVVGVDVSATMVETARRRSRDSLLPTEFHVADAGSLDFADESFDAACADRVFQHVEAPEQAVREMARVVRSGGRIVVSEPDWGTLVVDHPDQKLVRRVLRALCDQVRQGWIGRRLPTLFKSAGLEVLAAQAYTLTIDNLDLADELFGLTAAAVRAYEAEDLTGEETAQWIASLRAAAAKDRFFSSLTGFMVCGQRPIDL